MEVQRLPEDLAHQAPGPGLAAALLAIDPTRLASADLPGFVKAQARQRNHEDARLPRGGGGVGPA